MSLKAIPSVLASIGVIAATLIAQLLPEANAQAPLIGSAKLVRSGTLYVFAWPNGYSEVDPENYMCSGVVSNIDFSIIGPKLCIDAADATYCFVILGVIIETNVVTRLQSYGLVDPAGFDINWPAPLPPLHGPAAYTAINDPVLPPPDESTRHALDILHEYYQSHYLELLAQAQVRAAAPTPTPTPSPSDPPVTYKRVEYPSPTPIALPSPSPSSTPL